MDNYDSTSMHRLMEKLDYEIWVLDFLGSTHDLYRGPTEDRTIQFTNRQNEKTIIHQSFVELYGADHAKRVIDALAPLTFTASYKMIDMVYEWILEENKNIGIIKQVPREFSKKIKVFNVTSLILPPLFVSNPYLNDYLYSLFTILLPYRNNIIHNRNIQISAGKIILLDKKGNSLTLNQYQMGYLVKLVITVIKALTGVVPFDSVVEAFIKYYLDQLAYIHKLPKFTQKFPYIVNVELTVPKEGDSFPADLKSVREEIKKIHGGANVLFNLLIIAKDQENIIGKWYFPAAYVPNSDILDLNPGLFNQFSMNN